MFRREWALLVALVTTALFLVFGNRWFADLSQVTWFAALLGEPLGTLVLTLSMSGMEMMMIAAVIYTGRGGASLGRDTMLAIVMIVLNGLVGTSLLLGGLRYHEQTYNLYGANSFLGHAELHDFVAGTHLVRAAVHLPHPHVGGALRRVSRNPCDASS